ncbi:hypothetical protein [Massilia horti]|uniref:Lipoprotein n=1 Tax=Massilia horti TaxID=2562153 RepID=A0A4Y9T5K0_9BURK|nr:hypothetical protein [Massilia horti]TFW33126.1 hypothetical protein E4O92_07645 [Massilia horti]
MRKLAWVAIILLSACASKPTPPSWQQNAHDSLGAFTDAYLAGDSAAASVEFARARSDTASTGRPDLVAQVELVRCAAQVASLVFDGCPGFAALAPDATPAQRAYAAYLSGNWQGLQPGLLPEQHRSVVANGSLAAVGDPLARMVAAGALFKAERITPADIGKAIDTASGQGWRRPLLMWLGVAAKRAEAAGDTAALAQIRRRIELASGER